MSKQAATQATAARPAPQMPEPETIPARRRLPEEMRALRMTFLKDAFQVFAFAVAGIWALTSFWYQSFYMPQHEQPVVSYALDLQKIGERDGTVMFRARLKMHNGSKGTLYIGGAYFNATGRKLTAAAGAGPAGVPADATTWNAPLGFRWGDRLHVAAGGHTVLPPSRSTLGPGESMDDEFVFPVRRDQADLVEVRAVQLHMRRSPQIQPQWVERYTWPDGTFVMERSAACRANPDSCDLEDADVTATISLWDDTGHAPVSSDAGAH